MSNILFHNKYHQTNHHTVSTYGYVDSGTDPIGAKGQEFLGTFYNVFTNNTNGAIISANSVEWNSAFTTLCGASAALGFNSYTTTYRTVTSLSAGWSDGYGFYTTYAANSAQYAEAYTITRVNSSHWPYIDGTLRLNSAQENTQTKTFAGVYNSVNSVTAAFYFDLLSPNFSNVGAAEGTVLSFTRASSATFVSNNGNLSAVAPNVPRQEFTYNTKTSAWDCQGLLIEPRRTNLLQYSENFDDSLWVKDAGISVLPDTIASPAMTLSADTVDVGGSSGGLYQTVPVLSGTTYTMSVYIKLGTLLAANYKFAIYDATNSAYIAQDIVPLVTPTTQTWTRVAYTFVTPAGCNSINLYPYANTATILGTTSFYIWGAQLELSMFATSYIQTIDTVQTREQEYATVQGDFFNNDQGTFFTETKFTGTTATSGAFTILRLFNPARTNAINIRLNKNKQGQSFGEVNNSSNLAFNLLSPFTYNAAIPKKIALSYIRNNITLADSGQIVATDTSSLVPTTLSSCHIGLSADASDGDSFCGYIRRLGYYRRRVSNNTLRYLTLSAHDFQSIDEVNTVSWTLSSQQVCFVALTGDMFCENVPTLLKRKGGNYTLVLQQDREGGRQVVFDTDFILPSPLSGTNSVSLSSYSITVIPVVTDGNKIYGNPTYYYYGFAGALTYFSGDGIVMTPNPVGILAGEALIPQAGLTLAGVGGAPYTQGAGITIIDV